MSIGLKRYLVHSKAKLRLDPASKRETLYELYTHLEDKVQELKEAGFSEEEATKIATQSFGPLKQVANELNEAHSGTNWTQTLVAALPHLLFSLLFALHQWSNIGWLIGTLLCTIGVAVYGWYHNKPIWFFTWLGYALLPLLVFGFFLLQHALGMKTLSNSWWAWLLLVVCSPVFLWLFIQVVVQTIRRDWLLGSLMALPILPIVGWLMTAQWKEGLLGEGENSISNLEPWIGLSFLTLAGIVVLFNRLRQRRLKVGALLVSGLAIVILIARSSSGHFGVADMAIMASLILFLFLGPVLLEHRLADRDAKSADSLLEQDLHRVARGS